MYLFARCCTSLNIPICRPVSVMHIIRLLPSMRKKPFSIGQRLTHCNIIMMAAVTDINTILSKFSNGQTLSLAGIVSFYQGMKYYTPETPTAKKKLNTSFAIDSQTEEPLLQCILHLRRILTIHEGLRWQDIKRYGIVVYRRQINSNGNLIAVTDSMSVNDPRYAIQLPQDVINAGMTPNPRNK